MDLDVLVEMELNRWDWANIIECAGPATNVPAAFRELLAAQTHDEFEAAYWKLENHVVVQGNVFEAAVYIVPAIMAALLKMDRPKRVQVSLFELLYQIIGGEPHADEVARGMYDLRERCIAAAREGLWILYPYYHESTKDLRNYLRYLIRTLESCPGRLEHLDSVKENGGTK